MAQDKIRRHLLASRSPRNPTEETNTNISSGNESNDNDNESNESDESDESASVSGDGVMDKVKNVPIEKLREIVTNQIDLEIRLKHKELQLTEEEMGKCESQMITLRNYFKVPGQKSFDSEPNDFTLKYYDLLNRSLSVNDGKGIEGNSLSSNNLSYGGEFGRPSDSDLNPSRDPLITHTYRTRSTTSSLRPSQNALQSRPGTVGCLYRRTDGVVVKLTCPDCKRTNFSSAQGFLNHSRIAHTQEYTSQDAAALICGEVLPDYEQDEEGTGSIKNLRDRNLDPSKNLNVSEIYFNGLSSSLNTVHRSSMDKSLSPFEKDENVKPSQPLPEPDSELMKKLIKNGMANDKASYQVLLDKYKPNQEESNLFSDSSEDGKDKEKEKDNSTLSTKTEDKKLKRRRSRANVGSSKPSAEQSTEDVSTSEIKPTPEIHKPQTRNSGKKDEVTEIESTSSGLPRIRIKLKPEKPDRQKKRKKT